MTDARSLDEVLLRELPGTEEQAGSISRGRRLASDLRDGNGSGDAKLVEALCDELEGLRRQVIRLGLDLHDEGLQDLTALRNDLNLFRKQLARTLEGSADRNKVVGRVDDFLARVLSLDGTLRGVATSAGAASVLQHSLSRTLQGLVDDYPGPCVVGSAIDPGLDSYGTTDSQRIVLVRIVQSALANVLQHSDAPTALVSVACKSAGIEVRIVDDGKGFDVESAFRQAVEERRLGLLGMQERVRLLGGTFAANSQIGGPTSIVVVLPRQPAVLTIVP